MIYTRYSYAPHLNKEEKKKHTHILAHINKIIKEERRALSYRLCVYDAYDARMEGQV